jgi:hypothetical protein
MKTYEAEVMKDGNIAVADEARREMDLRHGKRVEVTIRRFPANLPQDNPLAKLIGMCKNLDINDLSANHDRYLYKGDRS